MKATLSQYRQSPRKVRVVADMVRGKKVSEAVTIFTLVPKRAGLPLKKLLESAIANAKNSGADIDSLIVKEVRVDGGVVMKRQMPRAFGRAYAIKKRTSHIHIELGVKASKVKGIAAPAKEEKAEKKATVKKVAEKKSTVKKTTKKSE